ncbi:prephenate dehydrogenase [Haloimpatiens sp. FM7330]|uniref:prephenate dehydrogenase n=1 Tax=Haloimpatiens sp. FM7330 TaxID=3298610 RepID=UPI003640A01F
MDKWEFNITIVGLGLIGGSFAMALKKLNPKNLWAVDINEQIIKKAENLKIIDKGYLDSKIPLSKSDIVIICLYPNMTVKFIRDNMNNFKKDAIITDTAGIKEEISININKIIPDYVDFIGGHPMAGRESKGLEFASKEIFEGADFILTPNSKNKEENINLLKQMLKQIGFKRIIKMTPKEHDEMVAFTSQLPHVIASALMNSEMLNNKNICTGGSFKDTTRVARINSKLWSELILENRENIMNQIDDFQNKLEFIKKSIENKNQQCLEKIFDEGNTRRKEMI